MNNHPTYRHWFNVFKGAQPTQALTLLTTLFSERDTEELVENLKTKPPNNRLKGILSSIKGGQLTVENLMAELPNPNVTKEEIEERLEKVMASAKFETLESLGELLDEAISIKMKIGDPNYKASVEEIKRLQELITKITDSSQKSRQTLSKDKAIRAKLSYFNRVIKPRGKYTITFEKIPENRQEFDKKVKNAEKIVVKEENIDGKNVKTYLGSVKGDKFVTVFDTQSEFLEFLTKNPDKRQKVNESIGEFAKITRSVTGKKKKKTRQRELSKERLEELTARNVVFETTKITGFEEVQRYLDAIEQVPYSILSFIPSTLEKGKVDKIYNAKTELPPNFFLTRKSVQDGGGRGVKSLILNPYATVLLRSTYSEGNEQWFKDYFQDVTKSQIVGEGLAELIVYDDLYDMLQLNKPSSYGFDRNRFGNITLSDDREKSRKKLKEIVNADSTLKREVSARTTPLTENMFNYLKTDFTLGEAKKIEELWDDDLDIEHGGLEIQYRNSKGEIDEKELASYATLLVDGRAVNPQQIKEMLEEEEKEAPMVKIRELIDIASRHESLGNNFVSYVLSLSSEELMAVVKTPADTSANFSDKLNPKNSLIFLSTISERLLGEYRNFVSDAFEKVAQEESTEKKLAILNNLNKNMPKFLNYLKKAVFGSFQAELDNFAVNYVQTVARTPDKIIRAIDSFKQKGLLRGD